MTPVPESNAVAEPETSAPIRANRRAALLLVAMLAVVLVVPALVGRSRTVEQFDQSAVDRFQSAAPEIVFLGNSLLETRIDPGYLTDLTGLQTISLAVDGTGPGTWYLQLKNVIGASTNRAETVFVFFHDDLITRPISFTGPRDRVLIEQLSHGIEADYQDVVTNAENPGDRIRRMFSVIYPISESSSSSRDSISAAGALVAGMNRDEAGDEANLVFAFANKRKQDQNIQQPKFHGTFGSAVESSFLPLLIEQTRELSIELIIVRVSARPGDDGTPNEPDNLAKYSSELSDYLAANDIRYIDMTGHPGTDAGMYYDGYHLTYRYRTYYTEIFGEWLLSDRRANP